MLLANGDSKGVKCTMLDQIMHLKHSSPVGRRGVSIPFHWLKLQTHKLTLGESLVFPCWLPP